MSDSGQMTVFRGLTWAPEGRNEKKEKWVKNVKNVKNEKRVGFGFMVD